MSQSIFHVRPLDVGKGWAIDEYDGRGAWQHSVLKTPEGAVMDKQTAQRAVFQLRRKTVNSAPKAEPVNKADELVGWEKEAADRYPQGPTDNAACEAVKDSTDPRELVRVAHTHWDRIGWPEDKAPIALLERAMALLGGAP